MKYKIILVALIIICNNIFSQTMVVKKADGSYQEIAITNDVEIYFNQPCPGTPTVTYESKTYNTIQIGSQCWLKENLDVGTRINGSQDQTNNSPTNFIEKYCYDDLDANCATYGGLYQWAEAVQYENGASNTTSPNPAFSGNVQGICPPDWHIPTLAEFLTLSNTVNENGNALKALGQGSGDGAGANTSGFSALFAGGRYYGGYFYYLGLTTYFWSSTEFNATTAYRMNLGYNGSDLYFMSYDKGSGFSVRCLKD